ncbi:hypothetical protein [Dyadobacter sp. Leaf189]|uniref:WapI family immunity protein n=1 Tax=Dyadobacter sp. Leaf189 TaxID=1736295 RepID=UPI000AEDFDAF|nr:hypothetical protein [Dyadobacter sp. Leaf189]
MKIGSESKFVQIKILKRSYPESDDDSDIDWLDGEVKVVVPGFQALYKTYLRTDDLLYFYESLRIATIDQGATIEFNTIEEGLYLIGTKQTTGQILWEGIANVGRPKNQLKFTVESDSQLIDHLINDVNKIRDQYPILGKSKTNIQPE